MATVTAGYNWTSGETVTPAKLNTTAAPTISEIVNADVKSDAAIAFSKLAALDSANILVGNGSNVATKVAVTGDVTISNAGVTAIGSARVTPTMLSQPLTLASVVATTSGTSIDFTGIPSWAKRVTVMLHNVSTNGNSNVRIQIGDSGGIETSGYNGSASYVSEVGAADSASFSSGFDFFGDASSATNRSGCLTLVYIGGTTYCASGTFSHSVGVTMAIAGEKTLSGALDRVRITTVNGTDSFDSGNANIMYEG